MKKYALLLILLTSLISAPAAHADTLDTLWQNFVNPPDSSRTKVWWFHGETETTKEGIDADLASFKEMGIGGVVFYNQVHGKYEGAFTYRLPRIPEGYNFDVCSLPILSDRISANPDGTILAKGGMTYKALIIPEKTYISPQAERIFSSLASQGAAIIRCDKGESPAEALNRARIAPDIEFKSPGRPDNKLMFFHRALPDSDIYFIYNHSPNPFNQQITLRTPHQTATIWDPLTCTRRDPKTFPTTTSSSSTSPTISPSLSLPLSLQPHQSCFLITGK